MRFIRTILSALAGFCACAAALALQAGITVPGVTAYPNAGMRRVTKTTLSDVNNSGLYGGGIDVSHGYGYFGTAHAINPGWVIKVNLICQHQQPLRHAGRND